MDVPRSSPARPWPVPTSYQEMRTPSRRAAYVQLPGGDVVEAELLRWLLSIEYGWYGYVLWVDRERTLHTEPVPAARLRPYPYRSADEWFPAEQQNRAG